MAGNNGAGELPNKILTHSVTEEDIGKYLGNGVINFLVPAFGGAYVVSDLPPELPEINNLTPYSKARDVILASTPRAEGMWGSAVQVAMAKSIARGIQFESPVPRRVEMMNEMFRLCDGRRGFASFLERTLQDYYLTSNGAWVEIERVARNPGAKIISFHHLDSLRVWRTGDPQIPCIYWDLHGHYHELKWFEVFNICDMESARAGWWALGECAAERAYKDIRAVAAMTKYFDEKITGGGHHSIAFVPGFSIDQIKGAIKDSERDNLQKGIVYYQGVAIIPYFGDSKADKAIMELKLKGLPDGWDRKIEDQLRILRYAKALGVVPQDLDPQLTARGALGVGQQALLLDENEKGYGSGTFDKKFLNAVNNFLCPKATTASFVVIDLRDEKQKAQNRLFRAQARSVEVQAGEISPEQALFLAVDDQDVPEGFLSTEMAPPEKLSDTEKPSSENIAAVKKDPTLKQSAVRSAPAQGTFITKESLEEAGTYDKYHENGVFISEDFGSLRFKSTLLPKKEDLARKFVESESKNAVNLVKSLRKTTAPETLT